MLKARLAITAVTVEKRPVSEVARVYGAARSWVYTLLARYQAEGEAAFEPRSRRPKTSPSAISDGTVELIVRLRKEWCRTAAPVASGRQIVLRGLVPRVQAEVLFGLQERCRHGVLTYLYQLRIFCRRLLAASAPTILSVEASQFASHQQALVLHLQQAVRRAGISPDQEQRKDVWNTVVLGHGRRRVIDFTGISQDWLREAVKQWAAEELPTRRGDHATAILQDHVHRAGELPASLRLHPRRPRR